MTNKTPGREPDLTIKEVAETLHLNPETIRIMARQGKFPNAYKTGAGTSTAHIRIPWVDVENYRKKQPRVYG